MIKRKRYRRGFAGMLKGLLVVAVLLNVAGCSWLYDADNWDEDDVNAADLMENQSGQSVTGRAADSEFIASTADFSIELFKRSLEEKDNSLVSPLSVLLALAMTANGADEDTLTQMESVLGGSIPLDELNEYLYAYVNSLPSEELAKVNIANSIWFRDADFLNVDESFLQLNANYYGAAAYRSPFNNQTLEDINNWVKIHTEGMIDSIIEQIADNAMLYLINAIVFDAEWENIYNEDRVREGEFINIDGSRQAVEMMHSNEHLYLDDGNAIGFIKPYVNDTYSFVALLPNKDISVEAYIESMSGESFIHMLNEASSVRVAASLPKFSYEYSVSMNNPLSSMGMADAFSPLAADFSRMADIPGENLYISQVLHKTFIAVDERGTKAGAATAVEVGATGASPDPLIVTLDRPFVYAIIDNSTNLPVFIGTVMSL